MSVRFIITLVFLLSNWTILFLINAATFVNFVHILFELRKLKKLCQHFANKLSDTKKVIQINGRDKLLYRTGEKRTAKSLTLVFFIQFICGVISIVMVFIQIIRNFVLPSDIEDGADFQIYFIVQLVVLFFPCINPIFFYLEQQASSNASERIV